MIILKTLSQIDGIRRSCKIVAYVLRELKKAVEPGITTMFLNRMAEDLCFQKGGTPGFKGYQGFPYSICSSRNEEIVHGLPSEIPLRNGDIISIDFGVIYKGWYGDAAFTTGVGVVTSDIELLMNVGLGCLNAGINNAQIFNRIGDISHAVQAHAEGNGYGIVREFVGHGVGRNLHEEPQIPNYGNASTGYMLRPGMVIAIEPMITVGDPAVKQLADGWTNITADGELAVHFEHTVAILPEGPEILTKFE
jgi:methionyl aminopeptidase